jgi:3'-phosphoadenosine 5'-phosphosulfate sulfotransferase (PAPS reductase)/FAD synthetase
VNPFRIDGPVAFSGGRTSGYMLHEILRAHQWVLPDDVVPVFCNTGKEHDATLDFVQACATHWCVPIRWVEYRSAKVPVDRWREVDYATASRNGEPFEAAIRATKGYLPNPVNRYCTVELKIRASQRFAESDVGGMVDGHTRVVGLRADEPGRVSKARARELTGKDGGRLDLAFPLYDAGRTVADVTAFWKRQSFDLGLPNVNGTTPLGNCDLCFLKGAGKLASIIAAEPERAIWWAKMENLAAQTSESPLGGVFRKDRPSYAAMLAQGNLRYDDAPDTIDCACTD